MPTPDVFIDLENGNDANTGLSFAQRVKTLARGSAIAVPGNLVGIMASTTPNSLGVNGTFARGSTKITLASAVTQSVDEGESAWTASANVTCTTSTTRKQGATSASIAIAAGFTTGLAAYKAFGATDYSSRQQLSFWFQQTAGTLGGFDIKLCSDAAGATPVSTFSVPAAVVLNGWNRVTINLGSAMSASVQSVAFYVTSDNGAQTYLLDNIIACNAPGTGELTHKTLIGKANSLGAGGDDSETWYAIRAIEGTTITLDLLNSSNAGSTTNGRYWGTSETVTAYSLFPSYVPTSVVSADLQWTAGGTDTQTLTISGGWNRTDMSTQTGQTWLAVGCQPSTGLSISVVAGYLDLSRLHVAMGTTQNGIWTIANSAIATIHCLGVTGNTINSNNITITKMLQANSTTGVTIGGINITAGLCLLSDQSNLSVSNTIASTFTLDANSVCTTITPSNSSTIVFNGTAYGSFGEASIADAVRTELTPELTEIDNIATSTAPLTFDSGYVHSKPNAGAVRDAIGLATNNIDNQFAGIASVTDQFTFQGANVQALAMNEGDTGVDVDKIIEMLAAMACGQVSASSSAGETTLTYKKRDGSTTSFTVVVVEADKTRTTTGSLS